MSRHPSQRIGRLGAQWLGSGRCRFEVWAPLAGTVHVHVPGPRERHVELTPEADGYFAGVVSGLAPGIEHLGRAYREGFVYAGQYSPFRGRSHGTSSTRIPGERLVICAQNHDQVGNRMLGERLGQLVTLEHL